MVGGRAPNVENERLYRFEFPESPGALSRFLAALSGVWNVSLFHYRNHGSDFGRVLAALQVRNQVVTLGRECHDEKFADTFSGWDMCFHLVVSIEHSRMPFLTLGHAPTFTVVVAIQWTQSISICMVSRL